MSDASKIAAEAKRWFAYAQRDFKAAQTLLTQGDDFAQQVCFLSQQAAEKGLKAGLILLQIEFPFRHDLDLLKNLLPQDWQCYQRHPNLASLTQWAVEARYPTLLEEPSHQEAQAALQQAEAVLTSIQQDLLQHGLSMP